MVLKRSSSPKADSMTFNTRMPARLKTFFDEQMKNFKEAMTQQHLEQAWAYLERAHILGQSYPYEHSVVHWQMLKFGFKIKSYKEVIGQIPRLLIGGVKSFVGKVPIGNTGGADIPPLRPLPLSPEIQKIFSEAGMPNYGKPYNL